MMSQSADDPKCSPPSPAADAGAEQALDDIRHALRDLKFGQVTIIVQDGVVIQVERTERKRLRRKGERQ